MKTIKSIIISILITTGVYGQDFQYSQPFSIPFYINPAFTGNGMIDCENSQNWGQGENFRTSLLGRNQWFGGSAGTYHSGIFGVEYSRGRVSQKAVDNINWGFGIFLQNDYLSKAQLNSFYSGLTISADIPLLDDSQALKFGYQLAGGNRSISKTNFDWPDEFSGAGFDFYTQETPTTGNSKFYGDFGSIGGLYGCQSFFIGASWHHIGRPNISMWDGMDRLAHKISLHGALIFQPKRTRFGNSGYKNRMLVMSSFKSQAGSQQWDFGAYVQHARKNLGDANFVIGLWYRGIPIRKSPDKLVQNDAIVITAGLQRFGLSLLFSCDAPISRSAVFGRTMEFSVAYQFTNQKCTNRNGKPKRTIVCPMTTLRVN